MRNASRLALWLTFALAISGCATTGGGVKPLPACPLPPPPPANLMQSPEYEKRLRDELFESEPRPTPKSEGSRK